MDNAGTEFGKRMARINRKHARLEHGYVAVVGKDGLIITKPKRAGGNMPVKLFMGVVIGFFAFKVLLISHLGTAGYDGRVEQLRAGSVIERGGAVLLQADPVSTAIAAKLGGLSR